MGMGLQGAKVVSIHAFRGEGDFRLRDILTDKRGFQSTPSGGKATGTEIGNVPQPTRVSIHAFRGEGDNRVRMV